MFDVNRRESVGNIDHGERAILVYQNGYERDVTDEVRADKQGRYYYNTVAGEQVPVYDVYADPGRTVTYVTYGGFTASYTAYVHCEHEYETSQVAATCYSVGYTLHTCTKCGYSYRDKFIPLTDDHDYVLTGEKAPTCTEEGYTGDLVCSHCHKVKPGGYGDVICALGHTYDAEHADEHEHECTRCGRHKEEHFWVYAESGAYMIKTCAICGYTTTVMKDLTTVPRVIVSSAYALPDSTVTVFVQLLNNSDALGITSVSFGVKFDERLTLVDWRQGDLLGNAVYNFTVLNDVTYFTAGSADGKPEVNNGNLVKLIFKTPEHAAIGDVFKIYVTDSRSTSKFTDGNGSSTDIICFGGEVTVTDRLPGDVNGDGLVDIWDAVLISTWCNNVGGVSDEQLAAAGFDEAYGDVNFDGVVNTEDMVRILRYLVGGFNSQLIGDKFDMVLNINDGATPARTVTVNKGDTYSVFGIPLREGYRFDGWFKAAEGGEPVSSGDVIVFDNKQFQSTQQQVLYAHWTLNSVVYETGESVGQIPYATYKNCGSEDGLYAVNSTLTQEYLISFIENVGETTNVKDVTVTVGVKGWATEPGGEVVYGTDHVFDLKSSDPSVASGTITLYPVWETQTIILPEVVNDARTGYYIEYWFENKDGTGRKHYTLEEYPVTSDFAFYASWKEMTYYLYYDGNGADPTSDIPDAGTAPISYYTEYTVPEVTPRKGIFRFFGWSLDKNATAAQYKIGDKIVAPEFVTVNEQVVCLYAVWELYVYSQDGTTLYFGTYPQERVTDDTLLSTLNGKVGTLPTAENVGDWTAYDIKDGNGGPNNFMWYKDVYHRGTAYRAVYFTRNKYEFGHYASMGEQAENGYTPNVVYWFAFRPIEWKVLTKSDGKALLYSAKILDAHCFNDSGEGSSYEHNGGTGYCNNYALSDVRKWLTGTFYNAAFSETDKTIIQLTTVDNSPKSANPDRNQYEINGGQNDYCCENTTDYVFLLSVRDLTDPAYGFNRAPDVEKINGQYVLDGRDPTRKRRSTDYALCMGSVDDEENGSGWMLTRSPSYEYGESIFGIFSWGAVTTGMGTIYYSCGVVPALWIKL